MWILIFSIVILWGFEALSAVNVWKIKLIEKTNITKDVVYFSEKLFEEIKSWGTIDYEEYFNRKVVGLNTSNGHYTTPTWFWNFWNGGGVWSTTYGTWFYYCRSWSGASMWTGGCYNNSFNTYWSGVVWIPQRYGQYAFQFIDYNSNMNDEESYCWGSWSGLWDENCSGSIRWDDDDEHLWVWPVVFSGWENVKELYLISGDKKTRTLFRWTWKDDESPQKPAGATCSGDNFWSGCIGTIEMLKLEGKDLGMNHNGSWEGTYDGIIDTWMIHPSFGTGADIVAGSNDFSYRQPLFPDTVNVTDFQVYLYPNIDIKHSWKDTTPSSNINPYLRLSITLEPSWKKRSGMKGEIPKYTINTTINLVDYFTQ